MKRSKLVAEIKSILKVCAPTQTKIQTAKQIADRIEILGMLPPKVIKTDPGHFPGDSFMYEVNEWEPEDET